MEDIARAAGVGRGTPYRCYPDRAAIAVALLDEHERRLQESLLRGDPPWGPGAPPASRLAAFSEAMVELPERHAHLVLGAADPDVLADVLPAPLAPELFLHQSGSPRRCEY